MTLARTIKPIAPPSGNTGSGNTWIYGMCDVIDFSNTDAIPNSIEAEQAVLGAMLINNDAADRVFPLTAAHFYEPVHGRIFAAIRALIDRSEIANAVTLERYFKTDDALADVGGPKYLARLAGAAVSVSGVRHYANIVIDAASRRTPVGSGQYNLP